MRRLTLSILLALAAISEARGASAEPLASPTGWRPAVSFAAVDDHARSAAVAPLPGPAIRFDQTVDSRVRFSDGAVDATQGPPRVAFEYSEAYQTRAKIHRIASFATLPLFATEAFLGQSLYNSPTDGKKTAHLAVAGAIGALFAVNTVTGVWNLIEARNDPHGRTRRWVHGLLMLAADAGFLATAALGPSSEHGQVEGSRATHRAVAFTAISAATAGYLVMLIGGH